MAETLQAGRELDALVAEKMFGLIRDDINPFSTDISAAWQVVEKWKDASWSFEAETHEGPEGCWTVKVGKFEAKADTLPLAVCHASLAAAEWLASVSPLSVQRDGDRK